jgi:hypothetical protein
MLELTREEGLGKRIIYLGVVSGACSNTGQRIDIRLIVILKNSYLDRTIVRDPQIDFLRDVAKAAERATRCPKH